MYLSLDVLLGPVSDDIEGYTPKIKSKFKRFCKQSPPTIQQDDILCINKFGGKDNSQSKWCNQNFGASPLFVYEQGGKRSVDKGYFTTQDLVKINP